VVSGVALNENADVFVGEVPDFKVNFAAHRHGRNIIDHAGEHLEIGTRCNDVGLVVNVVDGYNRKPGRCLRIVPSHFFDKEFIELRCANQVIEDTSIHISGALFLFDAHRAND
jgi:hypothetical protein